jgi:hypothetical protein
MDETGVYSPRIEAASDEQQYHSTPSKGKKQAATHIRI